MYYIISVYILVNHIMHLKWFFVHQSSIAKYLYFILFSVLIKQYYYHTHLKKWLHKFRRFVVTGNTLTVPYQVRNILNRAYVLEKTRTSSSHHHNSCHPLYKLSPLDFHQPHHPLLLDHWLSPKDQSRV